MSILDLPIGEKLRLLSVVEQRINEYYAGLSSAQVAPSLTASEVKDHVRSLPLDGTVSPDQVIDHIIKGLTQYAVHTPHKSYFGLFNPRPTTVSTFGDYITASFNPQMAAWSHAPYANEVERHIIEELGVIFGYDQVDGTFCSGGQESNLTAVQCAVNHAFPEVSQRGVIGLVKRPRIYVSTQAHDSVLKSARIIGLGSESVVSIDVREDLKMNVDVLEAQILSDISDGYSPIMIVATAGTTGTGTIDPIESLVTIKNKYNLWLHVDGAWGAAICVSQNYNRLLAGIDKSDSITMDFHKWFSTPMGGSVFVTKDTEILFKTYHIQTAYMPPDGDQIEQVDPYLHSIQWSRRFIGLKAYISLAVHGWGGYAQVFDNDIAQGKYLKEQLENRGWEVLNDTELPVVCVAHPDIRGQDEKIRILVDKVIASGKAWVSVYPIHGESTVRACITNHATKKEHIDTLVEVLNQCLNDLDV